MTIQSRGPSHGVTVLAGLVLLIPAAHPLLIPLVGVPSHLLWFVHVLGVALVAYTYGRSGAAIAIVVSAATVILGERTFGAGYMVPANWETALSLGVSLTFANLLMAGFALYARRVTQRYQLLFDASTTGIVRTTDDGLIQAANPVATRLLGASFEELSGRSLIDVLSIPGLEDMAALERMGGWTGTLETSVGQTAHLFITALRQSDAPGYQVLVVDRSTEVMHQQELERTGRLAVLGEALAGVAHELKNPLTAISGYAELGAAGPMPEAEVSETFETIGAQAARMTGIVQELLGYSKSREDVELTAIHELLPKIVRVQRIAFGRNVTLLDRIAWEGHVEAGPGKIEQIVLNLISNAVDAAGPDSVVVTVSCRREDANVVIEVADDGPGVPDDVIDSIFEPFYTTKSDRGGTGLGLAISRRLAHSMSGHLDVRNLDPRGAAFTLTLPIAAVHTDASPATGGPAAPVGGERYASSSGSQRSV